jgi:hypothetical protein
MLPISTVVNRDKEAKGTDAPLGTSISENIQVALSFSSSAPVVLDFSITCTTN